MRSPSQVLRTSRVMVSWMLVGIAMGAYDMAIRYLGERRQFGAPLSAMAVNQEKLMRMLGSVNASYLMVLQLSRVKESGGMSAGMSSLVKGWVSRQSREVRRSGRLSV